MNDFYNKAFTSIGEIKFPKILDTTSKIYFIGSCFSSNLYNSLSQVFLECNESPFGNVYNPVSVSKCLNRITNIDKITKDETIFTNNLYQHFDYYTKTGEADQNNFIYKINSGLVDANKKLKNASILVITLGTSYVYRKEGVVVNNCHKLNKNIFSRELLTIDEIVNSLSHTIKKIKKLNPDIEILITLSPVRHLRDSFSENSLSKSLLRVAIDQLQKQHNLHYFPSYEILLDELRDYRWYNKDLCHPSDIAVDYIINKFIEAAGNEKFQIFYKDAKKIVSLIEHKIINPESDSSKHFIKSRKNKIKLFLEKYPEIKSAKILK